LLAQIADLGDIPTAIWTVAALTALPGLPGLFGCGAHARDPPGGSTGMTKLTVDRLSRSVIVVL
jgi:hypothetical protein